MKKKINASLTTRARNKNTHPDDIRKQQTQHTPASNAGLIDGERRIRSRGIRRKHISALACGEGNGVGTSLQDRNALGAFNLPLFLLSPRCITTLAHRGGPWQGEAGLTAGARDKEPTHGARNTNVQETPAWPVCTGGRYPPEARLPQECDKNAR